MFRLCLILSLVLLGGVACSERNRVTLEFRLAEEEAAPGLTEIGFDKPGIRFYLHDEVVVDETDVDSAFVTVQNGRPVVELKLTPEGSRKFEEMTEQNLGKRCAMFLNGELMSAPRISAPIRVGRAVVAGHFTEAEAQRVANALSRPF